MTSDVVHLSTPSLQVLNPATRSWALDDVVSLVQDYTKKWPEPRRHPRNAYVAATDTDGGFERFLREMLQNTLPIGHVSDIHDLGIGDARRPAIVAQHELDLVLSCQEGRFVIEAKAWDGEVGKEDVIIFLSKILDFMAARSFDPLGTVLTGFIGLSGFTEAALRAMFALGVVPFTRCAEQISFRFIDTLLLRMVRTCQERGLSDRIPDLRKQRAALTPFLHQEGKSLSQTFQFEADAAVVDLDGIRRASEMFDEGRTAHQQAMACYREVRKAIEVDRA